MIRPVVRLKSIGLVLVLAALLGTQVNAQSPAKERTFVRPLEGALVLAGEGEIPDCVVDAFVHLAGGGSKSFVVLAKGRTSELTSRLKSRTSGEVTLVGSTNREWKQSDDALAALLGASGVWLAEVPDAALADKGLVALLANVLERGGALAGAGPMATALAPGVERKRGLAFLADSRIHFSGAPSKVDEEVPEGVHWFIPERTALVIHSGRKVGAYGEHDLDVHIGARGGWPERRARINAIDVFGTEDTLPYGLDLLGWLRSAADRRGPVFPAPAPAQVRLASGSLLLNGGGDVDDETFKRFLELAGGASARIVCIPSAQTYAPYASIESYSSGRLFDLGCRNIRVLHTADPRVADRDPAFLAQLSQATGVWIDGGRTFRFMDVFEGTRSAELIAAVLARGGVIGGSSAGCQVVGEYLVRGDPRSNQAIVHDGYTRGLDLLHGVVLDAHFLQRERGPEFSTLVAGLPGLLGIGVDEDTSVLVQGNVAEILGSNVVSFFTRSPNETKPAVVALKRGDRYDLAARKQLP